MPNTLDAIKKADRMATAILGNAEASLMIAEAAYLTYQLNAGSASTMKGVAANTARLLELVAMCSIYLAVQMEDLTAVNAADLVALGIKYRPFVYDMIEATIPIVARKIEKKIA